MNSRLGKVGDALSGVEPRGAARFAQPVGGQTNGVKTPRRLDAMTPKERLHVRLSALARARLADLKRATRDIRIGVTKSTGEQHYYRPSESVIIERAILALTEDQLRELLSGGDLSS